MSLADEPWGITEAEIQVNISMSKCLWMQKLFVELMFELLKDLHGGLGGIAAEAEGAKALSTFCWSIISCCLLVNEKGPWQLKLRPGQCWVQGGFISAFWGPAGGALMQVNSKKRPDFSTNRAIYYDIKPICLTNLVKIPKDQCSSAFTR